jgi:hypothetical protein
MFTVYLKIPSLLFVIKFSTSGSILTALTLYSLEELGKRKYELTNKPWNRVALWVPYYEGIHKWLYELFTTVFKEVIVTCTSNKWAVNGCLLLYANHSVDQQKLNIFRNNIWLVMIKSPDHRLEYIMKMMIKGSNPINDSIKRICQSFISKLALLLCYLGSRTFSSIDCSYVNFHQLSANYCH